MMKVIKSSENILNEIKTTRTSKGQQITINDSEIKYSEFLLDLIRPFLKSNLGAEEFYDLLSLGVVAWNTSIIKKLMPDIYDMYLSKLMKTKDVGKNEKELFINLIARKVNSFSEFDLMIEDFEMQETEDGLKHITVFCQSVEDMLNAPETNSEMENTDDYNAGYICRNAIKVKIKQPFFNWLNKLYPEDPIYSDDEDNIYLIKEMDDNESVLKWLKKNFDKIYKIELDNWHSNSKDWPANRTYKKFTEWFDIEISSMIYDMEKFPVKKD